MTNSGSPYLTARQALVLLALLVPLLGGTACETDENSAPRSASQSAENQLSLDVDDVLSDTSYTFLNQDSSTVSFPQDYSGKPILLGTIYTNCPNICPQITANMKAVRSKLDDPETVQFVSLTFDPERDTPSKLSDYRSSYDVDDTSWEFLTGDSTTTRRLLDRIDVRYEVQRPDTTDGYIFTHTNQITLIDGQGRLRAKYGGSQTPPSLIRDDLRKIQD